MFDFFDNVDYYASMEAKPKKRGRKKNEESEEYDENLFREIRACLLRNIHGMYVLNLHKALGTHRVLDEKILKKTGARVLKYKDRYSRAKLDRHIDLMVERGEITKSGEKAFVNLV